MRKKMLFLFVLLGFVLNSQVLVADTVRIAVASNFLAPLKSLAKEFTNQTGIRVYISNGASGMLYAKIKRGAPYDLFFSADSLRPQRLEKEGLIEKGSRFTYVTGRLVAWSPDDTKLSADLSKLNPQNPALRFLAMANPKTAPYGVAAIAVLKHYGLYEPLRSQKKIALGESVGKAYQYTVTGNAQIGLIALSYMRNPKHPVRGQVFYIPSNIYPPLNQQAVIVKGRKTIAVTQFLTFFHSDRVQKQLLSLGYDVLFMKDGL